MAVTDDLIARVAKIALEERVHLKRGESVVIETWPHGLPVARELVFAARAMGARPLLLLEDEGAFWRTVEKLDAPKAMKVGAHEWGALAKANAYVFIPGPADAPRGWKVGWGKTMAAFPDNSEWYTRAKRHRIRGVRMLWGYTSEERAAAFGVDLEAWREMVMGAALVPPREVRRTGTSLAKRLAKATQVRVTAENGTDLRFRLAGRASQIDDGSVSPQDLRDGENITQAPAGQLYIAPDEKSTQGVVAFDHPTASTGGWVKGIRYEFADGRLVARSFEQNEQAFEGPFARNKGDKDRLGMVVFGLNPEVKRGYPQATIAQGCVTLTLGDNSEVGGKNKTDFTFAATLSSATVELDGAPVVDRGRLLD